MRALISFVFVFVSSCGPKDVIPSATTHPANPEAPTGVARVEPAVPDAAPPPPVADPHAGHGAGSPAPVPDAGVAPTQPDPHAGHDSPTAHTEPPKKPPVDDKAKLAAAEKAAYEAAKPVFEKHCARCHKSGGEKASKKKLGHFSMDTYPFGGHHASEIGKTVREVLGVGGDEATMPMDKPGAVQGEELDLVVKWSRAFDKAHAAGLHKGHGGGHGGH